MLKISKSGLRMTYPKSALSELKIIMSLLMRLDICLFCLFLSRSIPLLCGTRRSGSANSNHTGSVPGRINSTKSPGAIGRWIVWIFGYLDYAFVGSIPCKIFQNPATLLNWGLWKKQTNIMQVGSNQTSLRNFSTKVFSLWILEQKIQFYYFSRPTTHQLISLSKFTDQCQISPILPRTEYLKGLGTRATLAKNIPTLFKLGQLKMYLLTVWFLGIQLFSNTLTHLSPTVEKVRIGWKKAPVDQLVDRPTLKRFPFSIFLRGRKKKNLICSHQHWTLPPRLKVVLVPRYQNGRPLKSVRLKHKTLPEAQRIHNSSNLVTCTKCKFGHMVEPFAFAFANLVAPLVLSHCLGLPYWYQLALS